MARPLSLGLAILLLVFAYSWGLVAVGARAASERDVGGDAIALGQLDASGSRVLVRTTLREGQAVIFELCADDGFGPAWTRTTGLEILYAEDDRFDVVRRAPFDDELAARVQRDADGVGCVVIGDSESLGVSGDYVIALAEGPLPPELSQVRSRARVIAWTPLVLTDRIGVWAALAGALLLVIGLALPRRRDPLEDEAAEEPPPTPTTPKSNAFLRVTLGVIVVIGALFGVSLVPAIGVGGAVVRGLIIALIEVVAAFLLVVPVVSALRPLSSGSLAKPPPRAEALGLVPPRRAPWVWLVLAPLLGLTLVILGRVIAGFVPSTGVAPIELFVEMPSGRLAVALVAVFVPVAEELFFRGFVFGTLERVRGANVALAITVVLFAVVHLPQQWGAWGAFVSVAITGLALTLLRRFTGSTLLCALVHLSHNAWITLLAI